MPKLTITVFLSPNESFKGKPDPSWPRPQGVLLQLTQKKGKKGGKKKPIKLGATNSEGVTSTDKLDADASYEVKVLDDYFKGWTSAGIVSVRADDTEKEIVLIPAKNLWLLPLLLCRYDDSGKPVGIPAAKWTYKYEGKKVPARAKARGRLFDARDDGYVYAALRQGTVTLSLQDEAVAGTIMKPQSPEIVFQIPRTRTVEVTQVQYLADAEASASPLGRLSIEPLVKTVAGPVSLTGASATIEYSTASSPGTVSPAKTLGPDEKKIWFNDLLPGIYAATVTPPATFNNWPVVPAEKSFPAERVWPGTTVKHQNTFRCQMVTVRGRIQTMDGRLVGQNVNLEIYGSENFKVRAVKGGTFEVDLDWGVPLEIRLARNDDISIDGIPLESEVAEQSLSLTDVNVVVLPFKHGVKGQAVDEAGTAAPGAVINVFDDKQEPVGSVAAGPGGYFIVGTPDSGNYYVAPQTDGGGPVTRQLVPVRSIGDAGQVVIPSGRVARAETHDKMPADGDGDAGRDGRKQTEALTDLAAYPVLTEEVSTTGVPAPAAGGFGGGPAGAGYGQAVDQAIRDVLGWRPGGDVAGFQAALTGAFQLREVEGHTAWTWQQRGYAVQADMGALRGAQASIYARAKNAHGQIQPLLAGITALNPALYPPQDLEAIRTVITAELEELVNELALEGGPRIQRVNELFRMLTGGSRKSFNPNPDAVQGQLGTMRDRFGLTEAYVDTIDEEGILTNFRIVVEQVLDLQESWYTDRNLLSVLDSNSALGTILIWLSRSLEAVCESVDDLNFALDSVFVDAAQRQVMQLMFRDVSVDVPALPLRKHGHAEVTLHEDAPLLLSDLLDWVLRACRTEGPRIVQDAGRDGVEAFAPVLNKLRILIHATRKFTHSGVALTLPDGMRTPRVRRALEVLAAQLDEAADLAHMVKREGIPEITNVQATVVDGVTTVEMSGVNFRRNATAFLVPANRADLPDVPTQGHLQVTPPSQATAKFRIPQVAAVGGKVAWQVVIANEDGTQSGQVAI